MNAVSDPVVHSLVLYRGRPARVTAVTDKLELDLGQGRTQRVRPKDVTLLHPGPVQSLAGLDVEDGEVDAAWELLEGGDTNLAELAELAFGAFTPASAWSTWRLVAEGVLFSGTPTGISVHSREAVEAERQRQEEVAGREAAWSAFLERMKRGESTPADADHLAEVEAVADGRSERSRVLKALGREETPEQAHRLLLKVGHWTPHRNPYPYRWAPALRSAEGEVPPLPEEDRLDLTHLPAYAIDDEGNQDPDDALSWDGERLWVHVADVGALVVPGDTLDAAARERGANLYLPESTLTMLPGGITSRLGLGLQPVSPALSFALRVGDDGAIHEVEMHPSLVRVSRLSYQEADRRLHEEPLRTLAEFAALYRQRRVAQGAQLIELPEAKVKVRDSRVEVIPMARTRSRDMVTEAMLMTGEATARFATEHVIPFPYTVQPAPQGGVKGDGLASMVARRRQMQASQKRAAPEPHGGLGLPMYSQATSPLRRYLDLVLHQQLRAWLAGKAVLDRDEIMARVGEADYLTGRIRRAERESNLHWKLVHLAAQPDRVWQATVVEERGRSQVVIISELALETRIPSRRGLVLDDQVELKCREVDLPALTPRFTVL
ncbi:MAG: RNB domain-containing ribonuclease [Gammaproteobacteria bacterium]|nr:RNB domain-containing ribonuclease [Gammaproteobacteria bacterium]